IRQLDGQIRARYDAFKDVYRLAGILTPEQLRERGEKEAAYFIEATIVGRVNNSKAVQGIVKPEVVKNLAGTEVAKARHRFLQDVDIDAGNLEIESKQNQRMTASSQQPSEYDIFISFATPDRTVAEQAEQFLSGQGLKVF